MDSTLSEKELERLNKLEQLGRLLKMILGGHVWLLVGFFVAALFVIMGGVYLNALCSPIRFEARAILYYHPRETSNISADKTNYVLQVLTRHETRKQFLEDSSDVFAHGNAKHPPQLMVTAIEKHHKVDRFQVEARAHEWGAAVRLTNEFAKCCIRAYVEDRSTNLQKKKDSLLEKKGEIVKELQELDREKNAMDAPLNGFALDKEYAQLRLSLNELQKAHADRTLALGELERSCSDCRKKLAKLNPRFGTDERHLRELIANEKFVREQVDKLKRLQIEIEQAGNLYTDINPRMKALVQRRQGLRDSLLPYVEGKHITDGDYAILGELVENTVALKTLQKELESQQEASRKIDQKLKDTQARFDNLCKIMPRFQEISRQYTIFEDSLKKIDASVSDIDSLLPIVQEDLRLGEPSSAASAIQPFGPKRRLICIFSAVLLTAFFAAVIVLLEMWMGKISGENELKIFPEVGFLGTLPGSTEMFESKRQEELVFSSICHNFQAAAQERRVVLAGALPGGKLLPSLFDAFDWTYAMAGQRTLTVDMVMADEFDYEANSSENTGIIAYSGNKGFLPVANKHFLSPAEQMLLKQDLEVLANDYEVIFIRHVVSLRKDRLFLEQIADLCDGAMLAVGAKRTSRQSLRRLIAFHKKTLLPIMTILSESSHKHSTRDTNLEVGV